MEDNFRKWLEAELNKAERDIKEGRVYSLEEVRRRLDELLQDKQ